MHRKALIAIAALALALAAALPLAAAPRAEDTEPPSPFAATPEIRAVGMRISHLPGGVRDKADAIVGFIFDRQRGLGFEYRNYPTRTAAEAFEARNGNCLSLVNLYLALARSAGLDAFPVEVEDFEVFSRHGGAVVRSTHVVGGLLVNAEVMTIDFLPNRPKAYRRIARIEDDRQSALFYNAVATEAMLQDGDLERAAALYEAALAFEPGNAEAWNNYAVLARRAGDHETARRRFERALALDRSFLPSLNNLAALHRYEGRRAEAEALEARALEQKRQSPYFLASQALRRMAVRDLDGAERLLQRARRIESDIPEVHLALGRVDLARGDAAAAERHFERARQTSRELSNRYRFKLERKIGKLTHLAAR